MGGGVAASSSCEGGDGLPCPRVRVGMGGGMAASSSCEGGDWGRDGCLVLV